MTIHVSSIRMIQPKTYICQVGDTFLCYEDEGDGTPIVLIHGNGCDRHVMRPFFDGLKEGGRLVNVELRGFGESGKPRARLTFETMADDLKILLDQLHLPRAILLGYSMGGRVAQVFSLSYPQSTLGLILVASDMVVRPAKIMSGALGEARSIDDQVAMFAYAVTDELKEIWRTVVLPAQKRVPSYVAEAMQLEFECYDVRSRMRGCGVPALILTGEDDKIVVTENAYEMARILRHSELRVFNCAGHLLPFEKTGETIAAINEWLVRRGFAGDRGEKPT